MKAYFKLRMEFRNDKKTRDWCDSWLFWINAVDRSFKATLLTVRSSLFKSLHIHNVQSKKRPSIVPTAGESRDDMLKRVRNVTEDCDFQLLSKMKHLEEIRLNCSAVD